MQSGILRKILWIAGGILVFWLAMRYLLPIILPFLLGGTIALAAEPAVHFATTRLRLKRPLAAGLGVSVTLVLLLCLVSLVGALAVKELGSLAGKLPDVEATVDSGMNLLRDWAVRLSDRLPEGARVMAADTARELFDGNTVLRGSLTSRLPGLLRSVLGWLPGGALGVGTGILAGFMTSARLPVLRQWISERLPDSWRQRYLPALRRVRRNIFLWIKAQLKLSAVTGVIVMTGFLLMGVSFAPFWAILVALVDAVPVLGTGTVLLPWALIELLQGDRIRALGLLLTYGAALLARTVLEPRLVGKHLGLDPLLTLLCLYTGYRLWGIGGMILAPMLAAAVKGVVQPAS